MSDSASSSFGVASALSTSSDAILESSRASTLSSMTFSGCAASLIASFWVAFGSGVDWESA